MVGYPNSGGEAAIRSENVFDCLLSNDDESGGEKEESDGQKAANGRKSDYRFDLEIKKWLDLGNVKCIGGCCDVISNARWVFKQVSVFFFYVGVCLSSVVSSFQIAVCFFLQGVSYRIFIQIISILTLAFGTVKVTPEHIFHLNQLLEELCEVPVSERKQNSVFK